MMSVFQTCQFCSRISRPKSFSDEKTFVLSYLQDFKKKRTPWGRIGIFRTITVPLTQSRSWLWLYPTPKAQLSETVHW